MSSDPTPALATLMARLADITSQTHIDEALASLDALMEPSVSPQARQLCGVLLSELAAARGRERVLRSVVDAFPGILMAVRGPPQEVVLANPAVRAFVGRDLPPGAKIPELIPEFDAQGLFAIGDRVLLTGEPFDAPELPVEVPTESGEPASRRVRVHVRSLDLPEGEPALAGVYALDVTDLAREREAARETEAHFRDILDSLEWPVVEVSVPTLQCTFASKGVEALLGWSADEWLEPGFVTRIAHPDEVEDALAQLLAVVPGDTVELVGRLRTSLGVYRYIKTFSRLIPRPSGDAVLRAVLIDVTRDRQTGAMEAELRERLVRSRRLESIGRLAGSVAHDFNNQLTAILGNAALLLSDPELPDRMREDLEEIDRAANRSAELTKQLLAFGRRQALDPSRVVVADLVRSLDRFLARALGERHQLQVQLPADLWDVQVDPSQLEQVITNLVLNARDALPAGGLIQISADNVVLGASEARARPPSREGSYVRLSVADHGVGIAPEHLDQVFEPFFTTKDERGGTGLGLATVHGIVAQSGGSVELVSAPGEGTTVHVLLPRAERGARRPLPSRLTQPSPRGGRERILVVDDQPQVRSTAEALLRRGGYRVSGSDGALEGVDPGALDLVIADVVLAEGSGPEVVAALRERGFAGKVIYMSGFSGPSQLVGAAPFLPKPFGSSELARLVRQVLDG